MKVRLVRKLAERVDDVDLTGRHVGDVFELPWAEARLLVAEQWAVPDVGEAAWAMRPREEPTASDEGVKDLSVLSEASAAKDPQQPPDGSAQNLELSGATDGLSSTDRLGDD